MSVPRSTLVWWLLSFGTIGPMLFLVGYSPASGEFLVTAIVCLALSFAIAHLVNPASLMGVVLGAAFLAFYAHVFAPGYVSNVEAIAAVFAAAAVLALGIRIVVPFVLPAMFVAGLVGAVIQSPSPVARVTGAAPTLSKRSVIHILLDEHASDWGLPDEVLSAEDRNHLWAPLIERGFVLFDRGFSMDSYTSSSVARMFNPGIQEPLTAWRLKPPDVGLHRAAALVEISRTRAMNIMGFVLGFRPLLPQLENLARLEEHAFALPSPMLAVVGASSTDRASIAAALLLNWLTGRQKVPLAQWVVERYPGLQAFAAARGRLHPIGSKLFLDEIAHFFRTKGARGSYYFIHAILPHYPYVFDRECRLRPSAEWKNRTATPEPDSKETRLERYRLYVEQTACTHRRLLDVLDGIAANPAFADATILVHGDHGSRITFENQAGWVEAGGARDVLERDLRAAFIAVRIPSMSSQRVQKPANLNEVFSHLLGTDFETLDIDALKDRDNALLPNPGAK